MKTHYCFLKKFNNYFNRKIIKFDTLAEYETAAADYHIPTVNGNPTSFDFNPNDNVMTEIIANDLDFDPDYFLLLDEDLEIISRWFVLEQVRNRQGQWSYSLRRDVVSDKLDDLLTAPIFVQKGMLPDTNPLVLNDEGLNLNQIKTEETILKDKSGTAWIVGYMAKDAAGTDVSINLPIAKKAPDAKTLQEILYDLSKSNSEIKTEQRLLDIFNITPDDNKKVFFYNNVTLALNGGVWTFVGEQLTQLDWRGNIIFGNPSTLDDVVATERSGTPLEPRADYRVFSDIEANHAQDLVTILDYIAPEIADRADNVKSELKTLTDRLYATANDLAYFQILANSNIKIIYNGKYYTLNVNTSESSKSDDFDMSLDDPTYSYVKSAISSGFADSDIDCDINLTKSIRFYFDGPEVSLSLQEYATAPEGTLTTTISSSRIKTLKQEFDAFAMPVNGVYVRKSGAKSFLTCEYAQEVASEIAIQLNAKLYDLQLLPYCPIPEKITENNTIDMETMTSGFDYNEVTVTLPTTGSITLSTDSNLKAIGVGSIIYGPPYNYTITLYTPFPSGVLLTNESVRLLDPRNTGVIDENDIYVQQIVEGGMIVLQLQFPSNWDPAKTQGILSDNGITIEVSYDYDFDIVPQSSTVTNVIFYLQDSSFKNTLDYSLRTRNSLKIDSNADMYRLVSPNYQGAFDFNVAKNGGKVENFIIECTYKPFTPLIKVSPSFGWLYGSNYGDNRGLICAGDFSLPRATSAWETFQLNNKNYQNIFNREIQNMDFKYN